MRRPAALRVVTLTVRGFVVVSAEGQRWILDQVVDATPTATDTTLFALDQWPRRSRMGTARAPFSVKAETMHASLDNRQASAVCEDTGATCSVNDLLFYTGDVTVQMVYATPCGPPPTVPHAVPSCSMSGTCTYTCDVGFSLVSNGNRPLQCNALTGAWQSQHHTSLLLPRCRTLKCVAPTLASPHEEEAAVVTPTVSLLVSPDDNDDDAVWTVEVRMHAPAARGWSFATMAVSGGRCSAKLEGPAFPVLVAPGEPCSSVASATLSASCFRSPNNAHAEVDTRGAGRIGGAKPVRPADAGAPTDADADTDTVDLTVLMENLSGTQLTTRTFTFEATVDGTSALAVPSTSVPMATAVTDVSRQGHRVSLGALATAVVLLAAAGMVAARKCRHLSRQLPVSASTLQPQSAPAVSVSSAVKPAASWTGSSMDAPPLVVRTAPGVARLRHGRVSTPRQCMSPISSAFRLKV